ncbi:hypothetical protein VFPFJ_02888 [Purpureocillium lilacinum]|uniref:Uncharacterized protein n=1 Tax=Purpureocillium lilacinum TaxID=33203 RepID=A0A179HTC2_PURLI|nr:hypothetical protein VFPFJ_02888 [Purpureocillium lilacinum]OAQ78536.1 hypothetical protein VFPBJ_06657 [Purpureocillium lilacinum]OAQ93726.1 hypothetical protein VFPFJ_02888 [Purpureocillium lilacinum]
MREQQQPFCYERGTVQLWHRGNREEGDIANFRLLRLLGRNKGSHRVEGGVVLDNATTNERTRALCV